MQFQLGMRCETRGRWDEAIDRHREALRLNPKNTLCRRELALVLKLKGNLDEAITEFREVIRLNPSSFNAHANLSGTFEQQGRLVEAEAEAREAIRIRPGYASHHGRLGMILFRQGRHAEAETELRQALELHPALPAYRLNLINTLLAQGKTAEAKNLCVDWRQLMGNSVYSCTDIAPLLAMCSPDATMRNPETAARSARRATELSPKIAVGWRALGWAQLALGEVSRDNRSPREIVRRARRRERRCRCNGSSRHSPTVSLRCSPETMIGCGYSTRKNFAATTNKPARKSTSVGALQAKLTSWTSESGISARKPRKCSGSWKSGNSKQSTRSQRQSHCACRARIDC